MAVVAEPRYRQHYELNGIRWTIYAKHDGTHVIRRGGVAVGDHQNRKSAEQTMFAMMRDELAALQTKAVSDLRYAITLQERIGCDWESGLTKLAVGSKSEH